MCVNQVCISTRPCGKRRAIAKLILVCGLAGGRANRRLQTGMNFCGYNVYIIAKLQPRDCILQNLTEASLFIYFMSTLACSLVLYNEFKKGVTMPKLSLNLSIEAVTLCGRVQSSTNDVLFKTSWAQQKGFLKVLGVSEERACIEVL